MKLYNILQQISESEDIFLQQKIIVYTYKWLDEYTEIVNGIRNLLNKLSSTIYIEKVTDFLESEFLNLLKNINLLSLSDLKEKKNELENVFLNEYRTLTLINNILGSMQEEIKQYPLFDKYLSYAKSYFISIPDIYSYKEDKWLLLSNMKLVKRQIGLLNVLQDISRLSQNYRMKIDYINKESIMLDKESYFSTNQEVIKLVQQINEFIDLFFLSLSKEDIFLVKEILKINNFHSQNARILALLIADRDIKRTIIPDILGVYSNLNPIISRLVNKKIKENQNIIKDFYYKNPFSIITGIILDLPKK